MTTTKAIDDVLSERARQVSVEGWTPEHDDQHDKGELAAAAACYAASAFNSTAPKPHAFSDCVFGFQSFIGAFWPWSRTWWKPKDARRDLVRAAALIIAEIERIDRAAETASDLPAEVESRYPNDVVNESPPDGV